MGVMIVVVVIVEFVKLHYPPPVPLSSSLPSPLFPLFVSGLLDLSAVVPFFPDADFEFPRSDDSDTQVECDEQVAFEHPDDDVMVHGYELLVLHDGGEKVVVVWFCEGGRDGGEDPREGRYFRVREFQAEFIGERSEAV